MALLGGKKQENDPTLSPGPATPAETAQPSTPREPDAIYQNGRLVARVLNPEIDLEAKEIRFGELYESDYLLLPDECEFQKYKILVQRVAYATKAEAVGAQKGRVLRGAIADILGYREQ